MTGDYTQSFEALVFELDGTLIESASELTDVLADARKNPSKPDRLPWEDLLSPVGWDLWRRLLASGKHVSARTMDAAPKPEENIA